MPRPQALGLLETESRPEKCNHLLKVTCKELEGDLNQPVYLSPPPTRTYMRTYIRKHTHPVDSLLLSFPGY